MRAELWLRAIHGSTRAGFGGLANEPLVFLHRGFVSITGVIGMVVILDIFAIRVCAVEHGPSPLALRDTERLGTLGVQRLKGSDGFPLETLYFALGMDWMP